MGGGLPLHHGGGGVNSIPPDVLRSVVLVTLSTATLGWLVGYLTGKANAYREILDHVEVTMLAKEIDPSGWEEACIAPRGREDTP